MAKFIMNTSILPNDGLFQMQTVDEETAKDHIFLRKIDKIG